jgi:hypothetical protein
MALETEIEIAVHGRMMMKKRKRKRKTEIERNYVDFNTKISVERKTQVD